MKKPDLSVAIIFKNEIRCLERCLKSIQPLKERISVEIVMADTGSDDGSRAVAEKYADVVFDFPWIDDFSAARNAVLDRCSGEWGLMMDCDEWLDPYVDELADFVRNDGGGAPGATPVIRNYNDAAFQDYTDLYGGRLLRLSLHPRYHGAIHEKPAFPHAVSRSWMLPKTILHHDGYVGLYGSEAGKKKRERNVKLIREELCESPDNLRVLTQFFDSANDAPDVMEKVYHAVRLVENGCSGTAQYGAVIYRDAVLLALNRMMTDQAREWAKEAEERFPHSIFTRIDVNFQILRLEASTENFEEVVRRSKIYFETSALAADNSEMQTELVSGTLMFDSAKHHRDAHLFAAYAYINQDALARATDELKQVDFTIMKEYQIPLAVSVMKELYVRYGYDSSTLLGDLWDKACADTSENPEREGCRRAFVGESMDITERSGAVRSAWQVYLPLRGKCILGDAAALMDCDTLEQADTILTTIDDLTALPPAAFIHALKLGAAFPLPDKPFTLELSDTMAAMLVSDKDFLREAAVFTAGAFESDADLLWARSLALAALKANDWENDAEPQALLHAFVRAESAFLARCYSPYALQRPEYLTPMQRFALHLVNAFTVLAPPVVSSEFQPAEKLDVSGALAELKAAVVAAPTQKAVVDRILDELSGGTL